MIIRDLELIIRGLDRSDYLSIIRGHRGHDVFIQGRDGINRGPD